MLRQVEALIVPRSRLRLALAYSGFDGGCPDSFLRRLGLTRLF